MATSVQMARLLQNTFMNTASVENKEQERINFLDTMFNKRQPIFKDYIKNNTEMVRQQSNNRKTTRFHQAESRERELQSKSLCTGSNSSSQNFADRLKPLNTI